MERRKVLAILGTRPEAVKMCPVIQKLINYSHELETRVAVTGQHRSMLDQILEIFSVSPDYDLNIMQEDQSLTDITVRALQGLEAILQEMRDCKLVMVQGDTTTAFVGALAAYYNRIPVAHIEAGLRTRNKYNPYPEEINRHFIDVLADLCFAPTETSKEALLAESIEAERIFVTGNTVIDALLATVKDNYRFKTSELQKINFNDYRHTLLVTVHRRENHGLPLERICAALKHLMMIRDDLRLILPVHLNPNVYHVVRATLGGLEHVHLTQPLDYPDFVNLMGRAYIVLTDSGGVQEEAPSLGKPVLVMRETTERPEAVSAGTARLVGTRKEDIISAVNQLLDNTDAYNKMAHAINPYGDGRAADRIVQLVRHYFQLIADRSAEFVPGKDWQKQPGLAV